MSYRYAVRSDKIANPFKLRYRDAADQDCETAKSSPTTSRRGILLLAGASFCVALGYGIVLPFVPLFVEHVSGATPFREHALHTGALLGIYPLAIFLAAPLWGRAADLVGGRRILIIGLAAYSVALSAFALTLSLTGAYLLRALAGLAAGAVLPVVAATVGKELDLERRARLFAGMAVATLLGLLAGPTTSGLAYAAMARLGRAHDWSAIVAPPIISASILVLVVLTGVLRWMPSPTLGTRAEAQPGRVDWHQSGASVVASFAVLFGLGAFEAILPLVGTPRLPIDTAALSLLFAVCMLVMLVIEVGLLFSPILHRHATARSIATGFLFMAAGAALLSAANSMGVAVAAVGLLAAGAAFLQPAIAYAATLAAGGASGALLGALTAAGSLGQAAGSFLGGLLFGFAESRALWFVAATLLLTAVGSNAIRRCEAGSGRRVS